ncbi:hypothetical protein GIB67_025615 [Kingdonia uniflora]|uniref:Myb/SANT-like domain-containing protein n=1 Tax=Kingdonia uniflora TaxID=39325 RepID=A0A7J7L8C0_9MAGN|nr:hypothetical protein GIB67_025615 [Kingdonia uniflora]
MPVDKEYPRFFFDQFKVLWFIQQAQYEVDTYGIDGRGMLKLRSFGNIMEKGIQEFQQDVTYRNLRTRWVYLKDMYKTWETLKQLAGEGYDEVTNTFNLTEPRWAEILEVLPKAMRFKFNGLPNREQMTLLFAQI